MDVKPKFKDFYPIISIDNKTIQIGDEPNNAFEIEDQDRILKKLIPLLNGKSDIDTLVKLIDGQSFSSIENIIFELNQIGLLDNSSIDDTGNLNEWELSRYNNNLNFFNIFSNLEKSKISYQKNLIDTKVLVLGMGGLGSNLLMQLSGLGVGQIRILDCDKVELKNLNRQVLYSEKNIGERKPSVGFKRLSEFNSAINYEVIDKRIESSNDLEGIITSDLDFVFCAADTPVLKINSWVNEHCIKKNIPFISGGVNLTCGSYYTIIPSETPCLECYREENKEQFKQIRDSYDESILDYNAAILPNISMLASMITTEFMRVYLQIAPPISLGRKAIINFLNAETVFEDYWIKNNDCGICSSTILESV